jgi:hypothetical protein
MLPSELPIGGPNLLLRRGLRDPEERVVVLEIHD